MKMISGPAMKATDQGQRGASSLKSSGGSFAFKARVRLGAGRLMAISRMKRNACKRAFWPPSPKICRACFRNFRWVRSEETRKGTDGLRWRSTNSIIASSVIWPVKISSCQHNAHTTKSHSQMTPIVWRLSLSLLLLMLGAPCRPKHPLSACMLARIMLWALEYAAIGYTLRRGLLIRGTRITLLWADRISSLVCSGFSSFSLAKAYSTGVRNCRERI